jgi:hypothetical protein
MLEHVTHQLGGVGMFGIFSLCLFFLFFLGTMLWALCLKKNYLNAMGELPLEGDSASRIGNEPNAQDYHE